MRLNVKTCDQWLVVRLLRVLIGLKFHIEAITDKKNKELSYRVCFFVLFTVSKTSKMIFTKG